MTHPLRLAFGADHGGFDLMTALVAHAQSLGHAVEECGTGSREPIDSPGFAAVIARRVVSGQADFGIAIDETGIGSAIAANKVRGARAAACHTEAFARDAREHDDANVLTLGAGYLSPGEATRILDVFLATACTAGRHRRVQAILELEREDEAAGDRRRADVPAGDAARTAEAKTRNAGAAAERQPRTLPPGEVARFIDHTLLRPEATTADIDRLCAEARQFSFFSVCVNPTFVRRAREALRGTAVKVCCVVGFPLGAHAPEIKALETRQALRDGAQEIDTVINIGALKEHDDALVLRDVQAVVAACRESRAVSKVILETALLTDEEKVRGCELSMRAGADFVKTSTGFSRSGATAADVALMSRTVAPQRLGVKAAGGVRTYADLVAMVQAGATRIGSSNSVAIMGEAQNG